MFPEFRMASYRSVPRAIGICASGWFVGRKWKKIQILKKYVNDPSIGLQVMLYHTQFTLKLYWVFLACFAFKTSCNRWVLSSMLFFYLKKGQRARKLTGALRRVRSLQIRLGARSMIRPNIGDLRNLQINWEHGSQKITYTSFDSQGFKFLIKIVPYSSAGWVRGLALGHLK